jgi:hypothetical protein
MIGTWVRGARSAARVPMPLADIYAPPGGDLRPAPVPAWLDSWRLWLSFAVLLIVLAYGAVLINLVGTAQLDARGLRVW